MSFNPLHGGHISFLGQRVSLLPNKCLVIKIHYRHRKVGRINFTTDLHNFVKSVITVLKYFSIMIKRLLQSEGQKSKIVVFTGKGRQMLNSALKIHPLLIHERNLQNVQYGSAFKKPFLTP